MKNVLLVFFLIGACFSFGCGGDDCADAAEIVDRCLGEGSDTNGNTNGVTVSGSFDENECKDQGGEDAAKCIVDAESTICGSDKDKASGALLACALGG